MENTIKEANESANIRKLATITTISNIVPIEGADNIEMAYIRGWHVVVKKNEFKIGDLCIYVEVDSVLPDGLDPEKALEWKALQKQLSRAASENDKELIKIQMDEISKLNYRPEFEFLRSSKFRIKTKRIFEEISQGICFPLSVLPPSTIFFTGWDEDAHKSCPLVDFGEGRIYDLIEDLDVTEFLGVTQFVPPDPAIMGGDAKGDLENVGVLVSDEERLENLSGKYPILKQFRYFKTEKLEGCLDGETLIETEHGIKTIKEICEIKYKGKIKTFDFKNNRIIFSNIVNHYIKENKFIKTRLLNNEIPKRWFEIILENNLKIKLTENHEIWISNLNCWRRTDELDGSEYFLID